LAALSRGFEADGANEGIEITDNALIEVIKLRSPLGLKPCVCFDGAEKACGEWRIDAFEEIQEDEADRVSLREQLITARVRELGNKTLGADFRKVVAERSERVVLAGAAERLTTAGWVSAVMQGVAGGDVREAHQRMHEGKLPRVIELEARDALSGEVIVGSASFRSWPRSTKVSRRPAAR
jgi:hypothetical protein